MQERIKEAYTMAFDQTPKPSTGLIEDCNLDMDSNATKRRRKANEMRNKFL